MKNKKHSYNPIYKTFPALLILFAFYTAVMPEPVLALAADAPVVKTKLDQQDDFDKTFRAGRDLIDQAEWARAAEKFSQAIEKYPGGKSADAALYWLAFCHKKQKQYKEADAALDRLLENFPASSWASDARVMKIEIAAPLGRNYPASVSATTLLNGAAGLPATASTVNALKGVVAAQSPGFSENSAIGGFYTAAAVRTPLDREDEIRIAAFQSLLAADPKRAIETLGDILKADSKASETLQQEVLRVLRSPRMSRTETFNFVVGENGIGKEFAPLLRATLIESFKNQTNLKIRREIIYALGNTGDDSTDALKKLYAAAENDRETQKAIINSFSNSATNLYNFAANGAQTRKSETGFLLEIVRIEKDSELRRLAFSNLRRFQNWSADERTFETVARLYDSESDEAFKISIIRALAEVKHKQATRKLLDIAKNDQSDKLRLEAIYFLRTVKDPEVTKFLEDLIK